MHGSVSFLTSITHACMHSQVIAVGESVTMPIAKGDNVVYQKYAMAEVEVPNGELVFVAQKSVLGKME
jgi:chaperonin GroES